MSPVKDGIERVSICGTGEVSSVDGEVRSVLFDIQADNPAM